MQSDENSAYKVIKNLFEQPESQTVLSFTDEPSWDDLLTIYAQSLAAVSNRLTGVELAGFAKIGISISRKSRRLPSRTERSERCGPTGHGCYCLCIIPSNNAQ